MKARKWFRPALLTALLASLLLTPAAAQASRPATEPERAAIAQLSGFNGACLDIAFSTVDQAFAAYRLSGTAGCPQGTNYVVLRANATGSYDAVLFIGAGERCPIAGLTAAVALDLKLCTEPPPESYLPVSKKLRQTPARLALPKKGGTLTSLDWSGWGNTTTKAQGRYKAAGGSRSVSVTVTLSARVTCPGGQRIYTKLRIKAPRGVKTPFASAGRWASCSDLTA